MTAGMARQTLVLEPRARIEHHVSAAQLLLSELLALPSAGLEQRVAQELDANPALELPTMPGCAHCGRPSWQGTCVACARMAPHGAWRYDQTADIAAANSPRALLLADAALAVCTADRPLAEHLLADVDDLGLLHEPVTAVAARLGVSPDRVHRVIEALRGSGAPGLCAPSLAERLRLQAAAEPAVPREVDALLTKGLDALAGDCQDAAGAAAGLTADEVRSALTWIRSHLRAEPFGQVEQPASVTVDAVVTIDQGSPVVDVVPGPWSALRVADSYRAAAADPAVRADMARADRFLEMLDRRTHTVLRVLRVAVARQSRRVVEGPRAHRPLLRRDVAAELGLHESTVSRVVAGKHLLLPTGETVAFAMLFGAARGVQLCLGDLVAAETVARSDAELAAALGALGYQVARRTVAKYRSVLGIPAQHAR